MANDLSLYDRCAADWWDAGSRFSASLHGINALRLEHIFREVGDDLHGLAVVDLGCGGGLVAEPLARRGAGVIGIDASAASIVAAARHGAGVAGLDYRIGDARDPGLPAASADLVCCCDVVEHIADWPRVLAAAARVLKPGGRCYVSTLNRTRRSRFLAVTVAEGLRLVPPGTHDPAMLVRPDELVAAAAAVGLGWPRLLGQRLRLWATLRAWAVRVEAGEDTSVGYGVWFRRMPSLVRAEA